MYRNNFGPPRGGRGGGGAGGPPFRGGRGGGGFPPTGPVAAGSGEFVGLLDTLMKQPPPPPRPSSTTNSANTTINQDLNANNVYSQPPAPIQKPAPPPVVQTPSPVLQTVQPPVQAVQPSVQAVKPQIQEFQPSAPAPAPRQRFTYSDTQTSVQSEGKFNPAAPAFQPSNNQFSSSAGAALPSFVPELCPAPTNNAARQTFTSSASYPKPAQNPSVVSALSEERAVDTNSNTVVTTMSNISNASTFAASTPIRKDCDTVPFNPTSAFKEIPIPLPADLRNAIREIENLTPVLDMVGKPQKLVVNEFYLAKLPGREAYGRAQILHADDKQRRAFVFFVDYVAGASVSYDMICSFPAYESWFIPPPFMKKTLSS